MRVLKKSSGCCLSWVQDESPKTEGALSVDQDFAGDSPSHQALMPISPRPLQPNGFDRTQNIPANEAWGMIGLIRLS